MKIEFGEQKIEWEKKDCSRFINKTLDFWYSLKDAIKKNTAAAAKALLFAPHHFVVKRDKHVENWVEWSGVEVEWRTRRKKKKKEIPGREKSQKSASG